MKLTRKRRRAIGRRLIELQAGPRSGQARAEVLALVAELDGAPAPAPAVAPPGDGVFVMRKRVRPESARGSALPAEDDDQPTRWAKLAGLRSGVGATAMINPRNWAP
jgi:hypothetical protein